MAGFSDLFRHNTWANLQLIDSTEHRAHVMTVLTQVGVEPPELDGWTYALETGQLAEEKP